MITISYYERIEGATVEQIDHLSEMGTMAEKLGYKFLSGEGGKSGWFRRVGYVGVPDEVWKKAKKEESILTIEEVRPWL